MIVHLKLFLLILVYELPVSLFLLFGLSLVFGHLVLSPGKSGNFWLNDGHCG